MKVLLLGITALFVLAPTNGVAIPMTPMILHGKVFDPADQPVSKPVEDQNLILISAKVNGETIATYALGENSEAGNNYVLRIRRDDGLSDNSVNAAKMGDAVQLIINGIEVEEMANPILVSGEWTDIREVDLRLTEAIADTDGDGLPDSLELQFFGNLEQNGDGDPDFDDVSTINELKSGTDPNGWTMALEMNTTANDSVTLGMNGLATDVYDSDYDIIAPDPGEEGDAYWTGSEFNLSKDIKRAAPEQFWNLFVKTGSANNTFKMQKISQALIEKLYYVEIDVQDEIVSAAKKLNTIENFVVPENTEKRLRILFSEGDSGTLILEKGWNLVSVPMIPLEESMDLITSGPIVGGIFYWVGAHYNLTDLLLPYRGQWLYCKDSIEIPVVGPKAVSSASPLGLGWNLIGPEEDQELPSNPEIQGPVWHWDGRDFSVANKLERWKGYWINVSQAIELE